MYNERIVHVIVAGGQLVRAYPTPDDANENADKIRSMQPNTKVRDWKDFFNIDKTY